jgi:hypothetical protein
MAVRDPSTPPGAGGGLRVCDLFDLRNKFRPILLDNFYEFRSKTE